MRNFVVALLCLVTGAAGAADGDGVVTTMPPLTTKRPHLPRRQSGYAFTSNIENVAYVAGEQASMIHFAPINPSHNPKLLLALPESVTLLGGFRDMALGAPEPFSLHGEALRLHRVVPGARASKYTFFWRLRDGLAEGTRLKGYYWGEWAGGKQEPQTLDIEVVSIPAAPAFERVPVWLSMPNDFFALWPDMEGLVRMGFNHIDMWTYLSDDEADWGNRLLDETRAQTAPVGMKEIAWIREWWWHRGQKEEDGKATLADGSRVDTMLCLSYRGSWFQALLEQGRDLLDRGIYFHVTDPEMYRDGDTICFCAACKERFRRHLAEDARRPAYADPASFAGTPEAHPELAREWAAFKAASYAAFFADYRRAMEAHLAARGVGEPFRFAIYSTYHRSHPGFYGLADYRESPVYRKTLEDPARFVGVFDYVAPMIYTDVYANYEDYDMLLPWKDTVALREITRHQVPITPILCMGYPFTLAFGSDLSAEMLRYNMLEAVAGGASGFAFWGECPFDAADMRAVALAVRQLRPYEKLILSGTPGGRAEATSANAVVKRLESPEGSLVLVSEYSRRPLEVAIACPVDAPARVVETASGREIARLGPDNPNFSVRLEDDRAVMLYVGP